MAPAGSTKRLRLLDPADRAALYDRPVFTDEERSIYFALLPVEAVLLTTWTDPALQAFLSSCSAISRPNPACSVSRRSRMSSPI